MADGLRVLLIEDSPADAALLLAELGRAGLVVECTRVEDESGFCEQLKLPWDLILADGRQPQFDATRALACLHRSGLDLPFIIVSGTVGEEVAAAAMVAGAHDYIFKHNLARLGPVIRRELRAASARRSMGAKGRPTAQLAADEASPDPADTQQAWRRHSS